MQPKCSNIVQLVTQLYDPANQRNPARINEIQLRLQQLQKGSYAWEIADFLLREHSAHHRFMGALTFTVKTNVSGYVAMNASVVPFQPCGPNIYTAVKLTRGQPWKSYTAC